jgi:hypothetical protein
MNESIQESGDINSGRDRRQKYRRASDNTEPLTVTIEPASKQQYSYDAKQYRLDRAKYRLEKKAYSTSHWTMIFLIVYTGLTLIVAITSIITALAAKHSSDSAVNSYKLTKRHTEDTDEAIVYVRGETTEDGSNVYRVTVANTGKISAHSVAAHIEISQHTLPSDAKQKTFAAFDINQDELRIDTPVFKETVLEGFGAADWEKIHTLKESIRIEGTLSYENGFDDRRNPTFCQELLTQPNPPGNTPASMNVLVDCNRLPSFLPPLYKRFAEMNRK